MPPLKGIDRGLNGDCLKALEEVGHGAQIAVVDASYDIPLGAQVINYQGDSSAQALRGILALVPLDNNSGEDVDVVVMNPDLPETTCAARDAFIRVIRDLGLTDGGLRRLNEDNHLGTGFYAHVNDPEKHTLFVRTRDEKAYACATFVVGHSQK